MKKVEKRDEDGWLKGIVMEPETDKERKQADKVVAFDKRLRALKWKDKDASD